MHGLKKRSTGSSIPRLVNLIPGSFLAPEIIKDNTRPILPHQYKMIINLLRLS
jgi:hypothetical protein